VLIRPIHFVLSICAFSVVLSCSPSAQVSKPNPKTDLGGLTLSHAHIEWPTPDLLVKGLRADDPQNRLRALVLIGASKQPSAGIVETPSEIELRFAALGSDQKQQAILAVHIDPMVFGAVAVQENGVWHRIASFSCWCKYESGDLIGNFVKVESGPDSGSELVLRASGGGTGVYSRDEARFRYYRGELHLVFSFINQFRECNPTAPGPYKCQVERRWFYTHDWDSILGAVLVESRFTFSPDLEPEAQFDERDLELSHARVFSCKTYKWNKEKFIYTEFSAPNPCEPRPPAQ
jgi:hypothetical protein